VPVILTEKSQLQCGHLMGRVDIDPSQDFVRIEGSRVLVRPDPEHRPIHGCPNISAVTKPCQHTLQVRTGYSTFVRISGEPVVLADLAGVTDGSPPAGAGYQVADPAQDLVVTAQ
jgi:hypothetical protein